MQSTATPGTPEPIDTTTLIPDPYAALARLRDAGPVHRIRYPDGQTAWLVTRYDDVRQALADPRLSLDKRHALPGNYRGFSLPPALDANLLNMDPPDHTRVRRMVVKAFTPGRVERMREPIRRIADALLDAVEADGGTDLLTHYATPLPITVICDLLGVPQDNRPDFRAWTDAMITPDPQRPEQAKEAVGHMLRFYTGLIASKRAEPGDDLLSDLIAVRDDEDGGDRLSEDELTSLAFLILFAGYENTVHLIANSLLALLDQPEALDKLRAQPELIGPAVEEFLRYDGPAPLAIRRFPLADMEIGGVAVPAGETVLLSLAAANRDPAHFNEPDRLDIHRSHSGHLALGHGIHYCLGASLARLETEIALSALLKRFPRLRLGVPREELRHRPSIRARGLISLPVSW
ncbi:cytochrome P450 [Streptomyces sp. XD-27]|uniref:cytochrome P450 family protein n=1 Tax=Streptomyces sp. XD-27 TaxID=3062779 RepID=UPI0026F41F09|nr:cytochrome P450 [Streptomyces sp. XD-27]WKX68810.1 cytochrome P450 [Streptomyces sp. XD-27]